MNIIRDPREAVSGILLLGVAGFIYVGGRSLPFGEWTKLGPAAVPTIASTLLAAIAVVLLLKSLRGRGELPSFPRLRRIATLVLALVLFGLLLEPLGLVGSLFIMMVTASMADDDARVIESIIFSAVMTFFAVALFVWGLGLPIRLFPWIS